MMPQKSSRTNHWKERQAVMAVALSLATYLYNSFLNGPGSLLISNRSGRDEPVLSISTGVIRGRYGVSREGREYAEFLGIPFAQPPLNDLRFEVHPFVASGQFKYLDCRHLILRYNCGLPAGSCASRTLGGSQRHEEVRTRMHANRSNGNWKSPGG